MQEYVEAILRGGQFKRIIENALMDIRERTGLKRVEVEIIRFLHFSGEKNTMKEICTYLQMNKGHISIAIDGLCKKKLITARQDDKDRRFVHYFLTNEANMIAEDIDKEWNLMMKKLVKGISYEDLENFKRVAKMIGNNIAEVLE